MISVTTHVFVHTQVCVSECIAAYRSVCVCVCCGRSGFDVLIHQHSERRSPSERQGYSGPQGGEVSLLNRIYGLSLRHKLQSKYIMVLQDFPTATSLYYLRPGECKQSRIRRLHTAYTITLERPANTPYSHITQHRELSRNHRRHKMNSLDLNVDRPTTQRANLSATFSSHSIPDSRWSPTRIYPNVGVSRIQPDPS